MDDGLTAAIIGFIESVGIPVAIEPVDDPAFMPGLKVRAGGLVCDRTRLAWPGDLLHEAGHVAVTDPARRPTLDTVSGDAAEEMAAIAWSYAAACALRIDPAIVFHAGGYGGGGGWLAEAFAGGGNVGVPMLAWFGMTRDPNGFGAGEAYPAMARWLR